LRQSIQQLSIHQLDEINFTDPVVDVNSCLDLDSLIAKFPKGLNPEVNYGVHQAGRGARLFRLPR